MSRRFQYRPKGRIRVSPTIKCDRCGYFHRIQEDCKFCKPQNDYRKAWANLDAEKRSL